MATQCQSQFPPPRTSMRATSDDMFDLQSSSSLTTTASSSGDSELNEQRHSLDISVGCLSRISTISKFAMKLNQIHHVKIGATYDDSVDGATVYVVNVYLRYVQKGLLVTAQAASAIRTGVRAPHVPG